jgi:hypothetical protein
MRLIRRRTGPLSLKIGELSGETSSKKQGPGRIYQGPGLIIQGIYRRFTGKPLLDCTPVVRHEGLAGRSNPQKSGSVFPFGDERPLFRKTLARFPGGRNSNCGSSPTRFGWFVKKTRVKTLVEPPAALSQNSANMFSPANTSISRCPQWQWK